MKKHFISKKFLILAIAAMLSLGASAGFYVTTSCGETYCVGGCADMEDVIAVVEALESLCEQ
jgi:uncharacterized membrane-anchored protein